MNKNSKPTSSAAKKLTVADLKRVIGGLASPLDPIVEADQVEDADGNKGAGPNSKASRDAE